MSLLPLLVVAFSAAGLSLLLSRWQQLSVVVGLLGLAVVLAMAVAWGPASGETVGQEVLAGGPYVRLFLILGCAAALLLALILSSLPAAAQLRADPDAASADTVVGDHGANRPVVLRGQTEFAAGALLLLGSSAVALDLGSPLPALLATSTAGFAGLLALGSGRSTASQASVALRSLRGLGVAVALTIVSGAALLAASDPLAGRPFAVGPAYLVLAGAVALRLGAIPFHGMVVGPHVGGFPLAVPLLSVWGPIALAVVVMATLGSILPPLELPLPAERGIIVAAGVLSLVLGAVAAAVQDDLDHIVAYSIVQDGGLVLLALAAFDPPAWGSARVWFLVFALAKTAFVAWALVLRRTMGSGDIGELAGWARRAPLLGVALAGIALATIGLPGLAVFEARRDLIHHAMTDPFATIVLLGGLLSLIYYGRLLVIGLSTPSTLVSAAGDWLMRRPRPLQTSPSTTMTRPAQSAGSQSEQPPDGRLRARSTIGSLERPPEGRERPPSAPGRPPAARSPAGRSPAGVTGDRSEGRAGQTRGTGSRPAQPISPGPRPGSSRPPDPRLTGMGQGSASRSDQGRITSPPGPFGDARPDRSIGSELAGLWGRIRGTWRSHRAPISASLVLAMTLLAVVAGSGGFGLADAAPANQPIPFAGSGPVPTFRVVPTRPPIGSQAPAASQAPPVP